MTDATPVGFLAQVRARPRPTAVVRLTHPAVEAAEQARLQAFTDLRRLTAAGASDDVVKVARRAYQDADAALAAAPEPPTTELRAMPPDDFERLRSQFTDEATGRIDADLMRAPLLAACSTEGGLQDPTVWQGLATSGDVTAGDLATLWQAAWDLNTRMGVVEAGKG